MQLFKPHENYKPIKSTEPTAVPAKGFLVFDSLSAQLATN
jgi:hypothetical protein